MKKQFTPFVAVAFALCLAAGIALAADMSQYACLKVSVVEQAATADVIPRELLEIMAADQKSNEHSTEGIEPVRVANVDMSDMATILEVEFMTPQTEQH